MKKVIFFFSLLTFLFAETLEIPIQHPASMMVYNFTSKDTKLKDRVKFSLLESNIFEVSDKHKIDFELSTLNLNYSKVISNNSQIDVTFPIHYVWRGFLDSPLHEFHSIVHQSSSRDKYDEVKDKIELSIGDSDNKLLNITNNYLSVSNIQLEHKIFFDKYKNIDIAFLYGVKIPIAKDKLKYFTTNKFDYMIGAIFDYEKKLYKLTLNTLISFNSKYKLNNLLETTRVRASLFIGYERKLFDGKVIFEYQINSSPFKSNLKAYDKILNIFNFGYREKLQNGLITYFISENLEPFKNTPDLTIGVSYSF